MIIGLYIAHTTVELLGGVMVIFTVPETFQLSTAPARIVTSVFCITSGAVYIAVSGPCDAGGGPNVEYHVTPSFKGSFETTAVSETFPHDSTVPLDGVIEMVSCVDGWTVSVAVSETGPLDPVPLIWYDVVCVGETGTDPAVPTATPLMLD